jgi:hypothetical protein
MSTERDLAKLTADLAALALELGEALADHHSGTSTTRPYRQTFERDEALLERTQALVSEAKARLGEVASGEDPQQSPSRGVQLRLEAALASYKRMDPDKWAGWVCYLLEGLEGLRPDEADHMLGEVRDAIEDRLQAGRW